MLPGQRIVRTLSPPRSLLRMIQRGALFAAITVFVGVLVAQVPKRLRTQAEQGDSDAQFELGLIYDTRAAPTRQRREHSHWPVIPCLFSAGGH